MVADRVDATYYESWGWGRTRGGTTNTTSNTGAAGRATPMELGQAHQQFQGNCYTCGEFGHRSSECPQRAWRRGRGGGGAARGNNPNRPHANVVEAEDDQLENEEPQ